MLLIKYLQLLHVSSLFSFATMSSSNKLFGANVDLTLSTTTAPHQLIIYIFNGWLNLDQLL